MGDSRINGNNQIKLSYDMCRIGKIFKFYANLSPHQDQAKASTDLHPGQTVRNVAQSGPTSISP